MLDHFSVRTSLRRHPAHAAQGLYLIVSDIQAARNELLNRGVEVGEVFRTTPLACMRARTSLTCSDGCVSAEVRMREHRSYRSFASFSDPDGNGWLLQEITTRLAGRVDPATTTFASANDLASAFRRAADAHGEHEKRIGAADPNWPDWYAKYMVAGASRGPSCRRRRKRDVDARRVAHESVKARALVFTHYVPK